IKPFNTLALNTLQVLSNKQVVESRAKTLSERLTFSGPKPISATQWLLDCAAEMPNADDYRVFSITSLDVIEVLGLEPRPGFFRYSLNEIHKKQAEVPADSNVPPRSELDHQISLAAKVPEHERDLFQTKIIELANKRQLYQTVVYSYRSPAIRMDK